MKFSKILLIIGLFLLINSLLSILFDIPMFYDFLPYTWLNDTPDGDYYLEVVPAEHSAFDFRFLWLIAGALLIVIGRYLNKKPK